MSGAPGPTTTLWRLEEKILYGVVAFICVAALGIFCFMAWAFGDLHGALKIIELQHTECTKREVRQFADVGFWFIPGSGEIISREVCVEWVTRR